MCGSLPLTVTWSMILSGHSRWQWFYDVDDSLSVTSIWSIILSVITLTVIWSVMCTSHCHWQWHVQLTGHSRWQWSMMLMIHCRWHRYDRWWWWVIVVDIDRWHLRDVVIDDGRWYSHCHWPSIVRRSFKLTSHGLWHGPWVSVSGSNAAAAAASIGSDRWNWQDVVLDRR